MNAGDVEVCEDTIVTLATGCEQCARMAVGYDDVGAQDLAGAYREEATRYSDDAFTWAHRLVAARKLP